MRCCSKELKNPNIVGGTAYFVCPECGDVREVENYRVYTYEEAFSYFKEKYGVKIGRDDGNIIALFDLNGVDIKLDEHRIQQCIFSDDTFHIRTIGLFLSFDSSSGSCTWKKELDSSLKFCGAGDIIFGLLNNKTVVGWDRYTGDELWYISQEDLNLLYIKPSRRHVIVGSEEGVMLCYKWSTPYQSA